MAFDQADNIIFELELTDPYTISALANCQLLPQGENLANILPQEIYTRLKQHLEYVKVMLPSTGKNSLEYLTGKKCMIMLNCSFNSEP
jgi:uncharacterized protein YbaP (TraB family)